MYKVLCLNKISPIGTKRLGESYTFSPEMENPDGILVRSAAMHDMELPENLLAIARAGAGVNNIPVQKCAEQGIVVFNTPGANANAVKELVLCALFLTSRKIPAAMDWVKTLKGQGDQVSKLVEKGKSQFAGPEIQGKALGVVGLGAIGILVANAAVQLGMEVYGYDPYLSVDAALSLSRMVRHVTDLTAIYKNCDYITIHVPQTNDTKGMLNATAFDQMKTGVRIINLARGGLVVDEDMIAALESGKVARYVTDFPDNTITAARNVVAIPHLGASTPESEENCAVMAAQELRDYLETGNIRNSVNLPTLEQDWSGEARLCIIHRNIPNMLASIMNTLAKDSVNVENMTNKSKGNYAYTIVDVGQRVGDAVADEIRAVDGVLRVRVLKH